MDDRHHFVGHTVDAVGWVQATRLAAHPVLLGAQACRATGSVLVRYRRYGALRPTEAEQASFRPSPLPAGVTGSLWWIHLIATARPGWAAPDAAQRDGLRLVRRVVGRAAAPFDVSGVERSCAGTRVPSARLYGWT